MLAIAAIGADTPLDDSQEITVLQKESNLVYTVLSFPVFTVTLLILAWNLPLIQLLPPWLPRGWMGLAELLESGLHNLLI